MASPDPSYDVASLLAKAPVTGALPADELHALAAQSRVERFAIPTLLNSAGTALATLRLVVEGYVEVLQRRASGDEVALGVIGPGGWATWVGCFAQEPPEHDFYSSSRACFIGIPCAAVRALAQRCPDVYPRVIADLGVRMRRLTEWAGDSVLLGPEQRMTKLLHLFARLQGQGSESGHGAVRMTQARLAKLARCSRQSANLLLGSIERRGLVVARYGGFEIPDMAALQAFVDAEPDRS